MTTTRGSLRPALYATAPLYLQLCSRNRVKGPGTRLKAFKAGEGTGPRDPWRVRSTKGGRVRADHEYEHTRAQESKSMSENSNRARHQQQGTYEQKLSTMKTNVPHVSLYFCPIFLLPMPLLPPSTPQDGSFAKLIGLTVPLVGAPFNANGAKIPPTTGLVTKLVPLKYCCPVLVS